MPENTDAFAPTMRDNPWLLAGVLAAVVVILFLSLFIHPAGAA